MYIKIYTIIAWKRLYITLNILKKMFKNHIQEIFFRKSALAILILLKQTDIPKSMTWISWETKINFSHIICLIKDMEKNELITTEKKNRVREITLTKKGYIIANEMKQVFEKLENLNLSKQL